MDFQGFQNTLPGIIVVIAIIAFFAISWLSYRNNDNIPPLLRYILVIFRAVALTILLFLLMNPYFYSSTEQEVKPKIAVFLDNSESAGINRGDYQGIESYNNLLQSLNFNSMDEADLAFYSIGENSRPFHPDSLSLTGPITNLSNTVNTILELEEDFKAAIIISDGIITYGKNPVFSATSSSIPIHTIAIGDTSTVKDINVANVLTNSTGYTNTNHVIEADINQSGFEGNTIEVSLVTGDDEVLSSQELTFETNDQVKRVEFELELEEAGLKQFQIKAETLPDEWSESNNSELFSIDVLDSKVKILHVAFEIHPDVKTVRSIINEDINNELTTLTWLGSNRFVEDLPDETDFDLIIIHGAPNQQVDLQVLQELSDTPLLLINTGSFENNSQLLQDFALIETSAQQRIPIQLNSLLTVDEQPIMELPQLNLLDTPALISPLRTSKIEPQAIDLFSLIYQNNVTEFPVISILEQGNVRRAQVHAWGWYKLYQSTNQLHRDFTTDLFANLVSWTSSNPDDRYLQVSPTKQTFSTIETPSLQGNLQNESGEMESDAIIEVQLTGGDSSSRSFNMKSTGNGNYSLDLPQLSEGLYEFEATARKGNRDIDSQQGEFLVSNANSELNNTERNDQLLRALSANTGGAFFTYTEVESFWDSLRTTQVLERQTEVIENYAFPVRSIFWFILVVGLLTAEWLIRKFYSLP